MISELLRPAGRSFVRRLPSDHCRQSYSHRAIHTPPTSYPYGFRSYLEDVEGPIDIRIPDHAALHTDIQAPIFAILLAADPAVGAGLGGVRLLHFYESDSVILALRAQFLFKQPKRDTMEVLIRFPP